MNIGVELIYLTNICLCFIKLSNKEITLRKATADDKNVRSDICFLRIDNFDLFT